mgnify:CR=1 FL=1
MDAGLGRGGIDAGLGRGGIEAGLGRGGIDAGLGRGGIDAGVGRDVVGALGAPDAPAGGVGRGAPGVMPNGLLPPLRAGGRTPGRAEVGVADVPSRAAAGLPGRGGIMAGVIFGRAGPSEDGSRRAASCRCCCCAASWAAFSCAALTDASCSAFSAAARASAAAISMSCALAGCALGATVALDLAVAPAVVSPPAAWPAFAASAFACASAANALRSRRATGASTVLDADLTNSPISLSLARTVLLSTPSSFASSCTRAFPATALLTPRSCGQRPQRPHSCTRSLVIVATSSRAHVGRPALVATLVRPVGRTRGYRTDVLDQLTGIGDPGQPQCPPEGSAPLRQRETSRIGMHVCPPARQLTSRIRLQAKAMPLPHRDDP